MGNSTSTTPSTFHPNVPVLNDNPVDRTPKVPLMKLKKGKSASRFQSTFRATSQFMDSSEEPRLPPSKPAIGLISTKTCVEINSDSVPRFPKIVLKKLEMANMDTPCEPEDDDLLNEINSPTVKSPAKVAAELDDDLVLLEAPFAVSRLDGVEDSFMKQDFDDTLIHQTEKNERERKKTAAGPQEDKIIICKKINNGMSEAKNKKAMVARKKLLEALFESEKCNFCRKALPSNGNFMKAPCGHAFHYECVEDRPRCPECGEIIEKGFTI